MENPVYLYDALFILTLIAVSSLAWRALNRRWPELLSFSVTPIVGFVAMSLCLLLLHVWAEIRPVPVFVTVKRPPTENEKISFIRSGLNTNIWFGEYRRFNGTNAVGFTVTDLRQIKRCLAWNGILPLFPKNIILDSFYEIPVAEATYKRRGRIKKHIALSKRDEDWEISGVTQARSCQLEPTEFWERAVSQIPIDFKNF